MIESYGFHDLRRELPSVRRRDLWERSLANEKTREAAERSKGYRVNEILTENKRLTLGNAYARLETREKQAWTP